MANCLVAQSGGPTAVINASAQGVIQTALASDQITRVLGAARPGEIVLMHVGANPDDGTTLDAAALPSVISGLRARGYGFVTLDAAAG